jgi:hypothetical protein
MSALIAVCMHDAVHLLTDGAALARSDGTLVEFRRKQALCCNNGVAVAAIGFSPRAWHFAQLADEQLNDFDAVIDAAVELWAETWRALPADAQDIPGVMVLAGWSAKAGKLSMYVIRENSELVEAGAYAAGPVDTCGEALRRITKRFGPDPSSFTIRDGVEVMEALRREHPRPYPTGLRPAVGGFITHTMMTATDVRTEVIHRWPDRIGHPIDIDASADPEMRDDNFCGMTMAEVYAMREAMVLRRAVHLDEGLST